MQTGVEPYVVSITPEDGEQLESAPTIMVKLSSAIDPNSVNENTFIVTQTGDVDFSQLSLSEINKKVEEGDITILNGVFSFSEDNTEITWQPLEALSFLTNYSVILTSKIRTEDYFPLNQTPGIKPTLFVSTFLIKNSDKSDSSKQPEIEEETTNSPPAFLVINEIYYDVESSDTDGEVFIELYGTPGADLSGFTVRIINGSDGKKLDMITIPADTKISEDGYFVIADSKTGSKTETQVSNADFVDNFDPQNGPDTIQVLDPYGAVMDVVGYGEFELSEDEEGFDLFEKNGAPDSSNNQSISRVENKDTNDNSVDFVISLTPTPGQGSVVQEEPKTEESDTSDMSDESDLSEEPETKPSYSKIGFTEVVNNPLQDWNDTLAGDGVLYNSVPGTGTVSVTDEWIEIYNGTDKAKDITEWSFEMSDGSDLTETFAETEATLVFSNGGSVQNFQPDEFLIIGNPGGDMKNDIDLYLYSETLEMMDYVFIEDEDFSGLEEESYQYDPETKEWGLGESSPLGW